MCSNVPTVGDIVLFCYVSPTSPLPKCDKQQSLIPQVHLLVILHSLLQLWNVLNRANSKGQSQSGSRIVMHANTLHLVASGERRQSWINY